MKKETVNKKGPTYIDRNVDAELVVGKPSSPLLVVFLGRIVSHDQCVVWQFLEEALGRVALDVEVECLGDGAQGKQREERPHLRDGGN